MSKILDELSCFGCDCKLSQKSPLYDTAWLSVYWCGKPGCAMQIMEEECEELDPDDECNHC